MAEIVKSALFVDYDSLHRSLQAAGRDGDALAQRTSAWVVAIESGRLVSAKGGSPTRRRFALRRCYADPALLGKSRIAFVAAGFEVIDCPAPESGKKNAAGLNIALDTVEALAHPTEYEEFVLLSADTDLTPILHRLHAQERSGVIYANPATPAACIETADGIVEEAKLQSLLFADEAPAAARPQPQSQPPSRPAAAPAPSPANNRNRPQPAPDPRPGNSERNEIEALARKVHAATNIPLLSPRSFAELFRYLAQEIAEQGYHFQDTAENVVARLTAAGRNVTRRQIIFVVKGLALKGHVFSTTDGAERLAEVFREQVLYLVRHAGLELSEREEALLPAWIAGRAGSAVNAIDPEPSYSPSPPSPASQPAADANQRGPKRKAGKPSPPTRAPVPPPAEESPRPPANAAPPPARSIEEIRRTVGARLSPTAPAKPAAPPPPAPRPQAAAKPAPPAPPKAAPPPPPPRPAAAARPAPARPAPQQPAPKPAPGRPTHTETTNEALESSILAAIAQAVDVLIEDSHAPAAPAKPAEPAPAMATPEPKPDPTPSEGGDSDDIGDEIQRIIASYSRARSQDES